MFRIPVNHEVRRFLAHPVNIVIGPSRWRHFILLLASLAFVGGGIFILAMPTSKRESPTRQRLVGWSSIIFFGACALFAGKRIFAWAWTRYR